MRWLYKTCEKKQTYITFDEAFAKSEEVLKEYKKHQNVYKCEACGQYHLTSMTRKQIKKLKIRIKIKTNGKI